MDVLQELAQEKVGLIVSVGEQIIWLDNNLPKYCLCHKVPIDPFHMTSQRRLPCIWRTNEQSMHNITFVNKANFVKFYNNFVLKWLIFALYVVVVPEQILLESIWRTL